MKRAVLPFFAALAITSCSGWRSPASPTPAEPRRVVTFEPLPPHGYAAVLLEGVPHVRQKPDFCGEACVEMVAKKRGVPITQDAVFDVSGMDPLRGMGVTTRELAVALERLGGEPDLETLQRKLETFVLGL